MNLLCYSLSFGRLSAGEREAYALSPHQRARLCGALREAGAREALILCTCNRSEFYLCLPKTHNLPFARILAEICGAEEGDIEGGADVLRDQEAIAHLFCLSCGLRSLVIGESEILGQLKRAYAEALAQEMCGPYLNQIFQRSFALAKQVRTGTELGKVRVSVATAAVKRIRGEKAELLGGAITVWGAGTVGLALIEELRRYGVRGGTLLSRNPKRELQLPAGWRMACGHDFRAVLAETDVLLSCTSAPHLLLLPEHLDGRERPLLLLDLAIPRDIDPRVADLPGITLWDIDALRPSAGESAPISASLAEELANRLRAEAQRSWQCLQAGATQRCLSRWRLEAHELLEDEMARLEHEWPDMPTELRKRYHKFARSLLHRTLHWPSTAINHAQRHNLPCAPFLEEGDDTE